MLCQIQQQKVIGYLKSPSFSAFSGSILQTRRNRRNRNFSAVNAKTDNAEVVICGGGIAGVALAYQLAVKRNVKDVVLVDERTPLSLTSAVSTECYRNIWPNVEMTTLMNRSIDFMEEMSHESDNFFNMTQRGYLYLTSNEKLASSFKSAERDISALGLGKFNLYSTAKDAAHWERPVESGLSSCSGIDVILGREAISACFPWTDKSIIGALHARRCGWVDAQQMGEYMLNRVRNAGVRVIKGQIRKMSCSSSCSETRPSINSVSVYQDWNDNQSITIKTNKFVNAAGPYAAAVHDLLVKESISKDFKHEKEILQKLPLKNEIHAKVIFNDDKGAIPNDAPMTIFANSLNLQWSDEEETFLLFERELNTHLNDDEENKWCQLSRWLGDLPSHVCFIFFNFEFFFVPKFIPNDLFLKYFSKKHIHFRPCSDGHALMLWDFAHSEAPISYIDNKPFSSWPNPDLTTSYDEMYVDMVTRGLGVSVVPDLLEKYVHSGYISPKTTVDGGYYCQTPDNLPLIGAVPGIEGAFTLAGFSGFGIMSCQAAGDLLATIMTGIEANCSVKTPNLNNSETLWNPSIIRAFSLDKYMDRTKERCSKETEKYLVSKSLAKIVGQI